MRVMATLLLVTTLVPASPYQAIASGQETVTSDAQVCSLSSAIVLCFSVSMVTYLTCAIIIGVSCPVAPEDIPHSSNDFYTYSNLTSTSTERYSCKKSLYSGLYYYYGDCYRLKYTETRVANSL